MYPYEYACVPREYPMSTSQAQQKKMTMQLFHGKVEPADIMQASTSGTSGTSGTLGTLGTMGTTGTTASFHWGCSRHLWACEYYGHRPCRARSATAGSCEYSSTPYVLRVPPLAHRRRAGSGTAGSCRRSRASPSSKGRSRKSSARARRRGAVRAFR